MNILLLGGTGFLGKKCAKELCKNHKVIVTGLTDDNGFDNEFNCYNIPIQETESLIALIKNNKIDVVMHFISSLIPSSDIDKYFFDLQYIYIPTQHLLEFCSKNNIKFVYISSGGAVYGNQCEVFSEDTKREPASYYGLSKLNFENLILFYHNMFNLNYMILRPSNPYGTGQNLYGKQGLIAVIIGKIISGDPIEIWGDGTAVKDYIYIDDFTYYVSQLLILRKSWNNIYNIGSGIGSSIKDVLEAFKKNNITLPNIIYSSDYKSDVKHMILNCSKLQEVIPHNCISLVEGIKQFYDNSFKNS